MRIALWGNFGTHNLGNECTLAAAILQLRRHLPDAQLSAICSEPCDTAARHGIPAERIATASSTEGRAGRPKLLRMAGRLGGECADWTRAIRRCRRLDALLVVGTGILTDTEEGVLGFPYELYKWAVAARLGGARLLFVSVGVEAVRGSVARHFITGALGRADYRSYRDARCAALLANLGFDAAADQVFPDLAFGLPPAAARAPSGNAPRTVAVGVYNYRGRGEGSAEAAAEYARYLEQICGLIRWLLETGHGVRVIIGDLAYDREVQADVRGRLLALGVELRPGAYADEPAGSFEELLGQLAGTDVVIASRYHNVLLALLCGKPVVSLSYEGKNEELMREMGLADFCQTLDALDLERLIGQVRSLQERYRELCERVSAGSAAARRRLAAQYEQIAGRLRGGGRQGA